jgi:hypothetical protein
LRRVRGQVIGVREALSPLLLVGALLRSAPRSTSCTAPAIADCSPSFTIATKETNLRNQLFRKRKGVTELALARNPDTSKLGRKQTRIKRRKRAPRTKAQETQLNAAGHEKQRGEKNPKLLDSKLLVKGAEVYGIGWLEGWEF